MKFIKKNTISFSWFGIRMLKKLWQLKEDKFKHILFLDNFEDHTAFPWRK